MLTTILFDLDGTLNNLNMDFFSQDYLAALTPYFQHLIPPKRFPGELMRCTYAMIDNTDPALTGLEVFWDVFPKAVGCARAVLEPIFTRFYAEEFPRLRPASVTNPAARLMMRTVTARGYTPVIATNPIFPLAAIIERLRWADCLEFPYAYITCGEEMHFCKPNPEFFTEVLARLGRAPAECLMVGNDMEEDMIAQRLGFATALVTHCPIDRGRARLTPDWRGNLSDLAALFAEGREREVFAPD